MSTPIIQVNNLYTGYGPHEVHKNLTFEVERGAIFTLVGGSGAGKSTLLRVLVGLQKPLSGSVEVLGINIEAMTPTNRRAYYHQIGFLFQEGALFGNVTVLENVALPLKRLAGLSPSDANTLAAVKLELAGLDTSVGRLLPSALSGGMRKRVALARALALDPPLLYLDEPTAGLDPEAADGFDQLILSLKERLGLTIFMVTHDLSTIHETATRIGILAHQQITVGALADLRANRDPAIHQYFHSKRANEIFGTR